MEANIIRFATRMSSQELANVAYSYVQSLNASDEVIAELIPIIMERLHQFKPVELCQVLRAFTESDNMTPEMVKAFEIEFGGRYESMKPDDIS